MIDEKKLISHIEKQYRLWGEKYDAMQILGDIEDFPKVDGWIPVEERLPSEKGQYLVTFHPCYWDDVKSDVLVGIDNFMGKTSWSRRKYQRVTAWMPLPEPYAKGAKKNERL